ncbi:unnamed protein product [Symbiodinium sp. CCMP2592]|nr:unnamed protein product [Symbiodinium sp. CCMP2592]
MAAAPLAGPQTLPQTVAVPENPLPNTGAQQVATASQNLVPSGPSQLQRLPPMVVHANPAPVTLHVAPTRRDSMVSETTAAGDDGVSVADLIAEMETQLAPEGQTAPVPAGLQHGASMLTAAASFDDLSKDLVPSDTSAALQAKAPQIKPGPVPGPTAIINSGTHKTEYKTFQRFCQNSPGAEELKKVWVQGGPQRLAMFQKFVLTGVFKQFFESEDRLSWRDRFDLPDPPEWDRGEAESLFPAEKKRKVLDADFAPGICFTVVRKTEGLSWEDQRQQDSDKAIARWIFIIVKWSETCPDLLVCQSLAECTETEQRNNVIQDWLHPKAPSTLLKRAHSIMSYHKVFGWGAGTLPHSERDVYRYMSDAKAGGAKPSQLKALREAIIFVRHVFMVPQLDGVIESRRCLGASQRGTVKRRKKRARPLSILELKKLHHLLANEEVPAWDRAFAGAVLCCTYMRARWGDFQHAVSFDIETNDKGDIVFLVYTVEVYKTVNAKYFSGEPVRFIAPGIGMLGENWLHLWKKARAEVGLYSFLPPLPTPNAAGEAMGCSVSSSEITAWIQKVLARDPSLSTTGHLMKRTFLTMAAKRGIEHLDRLAMGGHAHSAKMADTYGDDELARPLRLLLALLEGSSTQMLDGPVTFKVRAYVSAGWMRIGRCTSSWRLARRQWLGWPLGAVRQ